jgi:uncharacterized metal-binding protein YceD (DUF177 family)
MTKAEDKKQFVIDVPSLARGTWVVDTSLHAGWLNTVLSNCEYKVLPSKGHCALKAEDVSTGVRVTGRVTVDASTECSTCLGDVPMVIKAAVDSYMKPSSESRLPKEELTSEDLEYEFYDGNQIVLDELISDGILLELPMNPRCNGPCQKMEHLVTADEAEKNKPKVDPRLQALADPGLRRRVKSGSSKEENI